MSRSEAREHVRDSDGGLGWLLPLTVAREQAMESRSEGPMVSKRPAASLATLRYRSGSEWPTEANDRTSIANWLSEIPYILQRSRMKQGFRVYGW